MDSRSLTPHEAGFGIRGDITFCCSNYRFSSFDCNCKGKQDLLERSSPEFNMVQNMTATQQFTHCIYMTAVNNWKHEDCERKQSWFICVCQLFFFFCSIPADRFGDKIITFICANCQN